QQRRILQAVAEARRGLRGACGGGRGHGVTPADWALRFFRPEYRPKTAAMHRFAAGRASNESVKIGKSGQKTAVRDGGCVRQRRSNRSRAGQSSGPPPPW